MDQAVVRSKLASMIARAETAQGALRLKLFYHRLNDSAPAAWIESITLQMCKMKYKDQAEHLAGVCYPTIKYRSFC